MYIYNSATYNNTCKHSLSKVASVFSESLVANNVTAALCLG